MFAEYVLQLFLIFQALASKKTSGLSDLDLVNAIGFINAKLQNFVTTSKLTSSIKNKAELNSISGGLLNKIRVVTEAANGDTVIEMEEEEEEEEDLISMIDGETAKPEPRVSPRKTIRMRASSPVGKAPGLRARSPSPFPSDPENPLDSTTATGTTEIDDDESGHIYIGSDLPVKKLPGQDGQIANKVRPII